MADEPSAHHRLTPLEHASHPNMDRIAAMGVSGTMCAVPEGYNPGSEVANLGILGYDVHEVYEGRGPLEAASIGVDVADDEVAYRMNLICVADGKIKNHSAGHISDDEAAELIAALDNQLTDENIKINQGVSYRHLLRIKNASKAVTLVPPHDVPGTPVDDMLPVASDAVGEDTAVLLRKLIQRSFDILSSHPVNKHRISQGKDPANMIWPWAGGYRPKMLTLDQQYGIRQGTVISAVDLIKGIGKLAGLKVPDIKGATGLWNTDYQAKVNEALSALKQGDQLVFVHLEGPDEAGHEGDYELKCKTVEDIDQKVVAPILDYALAQDDVCVAVLPDHPTPCDIRTHTRKPIPFTIFKPGLKPDGVVLYTEAGAQASGLSLTSHLFLPFLLQL